MNKPKIKLRKSRVGERVTQEPMEYATIGQEKAVEENQVNRLVRQLEKGAKEKQDLESELLEVYRALFAAPENNSY